MSMPADRGPRPAPIRRGAAPVAAAAIVAVAGALAAVLASGGCGSSDADTPAADAIRGRWITDAREYRDRRLEITGEEIVFGTGHGSSARHRILDLQVDPDTGGAQAWTIVYEDEDGAPARLRVTVMRDRDQPVLRLSHRDGVEWRRAAR